MRLPRDPRTSGRERDSCARASLIPPGALPPKEPAMGFGYDAEVECEGDECRNVVDRVWHVGGRKLCYTCAHKAGHFNARITRDVVAGAAPPKWWAVIVRDGAFTCIVGPFDDWRAARRQARGLSTGDRASAGFICGTSRAALRVKDLHVVTLDGCIVQHGKAHGCSGCEGDTPAPAPAKRISKAEALALMQATVDLAHAHLDALRWVESKSFDRPRIERTATKQGVTRGASDLLEALCKAGAFEE